MEEEITGPLADVAETAIQLITEFGLSVLGALTILVIGWLVAGWAQRTTRRALRKSGKIDQILVGFLSSLVRYGILIFVVMAVIAQFGIQTTSFIAVLGAAGLAVGLAFQGTLGNFASGIMLLIFRPFKVGDYVSVAGNDGTVVNLGLFSTEMKTPDNVQIIVPNGQIWGSALKNFNGHPTRRVDLTIGIGYDDNIDLAMKAIRDVIISDERSHSEPELVVAVIELADSAVNLTARVWCDAENYWALRWDLIKAVKERLDREGISIPYPQRDVHLYQSSDT